MGITAITEDTSELINPTGETPRIEENLSDPQTISDTLETTKAAFIRSNPIASAATLGFNEQPAVSLSQSQIVNNFIEPNYDFSQSITGTKYSKYMNRFALTTNSSQKQALMQKIDQEEDLNTILSKGDGLSYFIGSLTGAALDPLIAVPLTTIYKEGKLASTLLNAATGSGLFAGVTGIQEAELHASQTTRTLNESMYNTVAGGIMGGVLGGAIGLASGVGIAANKSHIESILKNIEPEPNLSIGAARAERLAPEETEIAPIAPNWLHKAFPEQAKTLDRWLVKGLQVPFFKSPSLEGLVSESPTLRELTTKLFDIPVNLKGQIAKDGYLGKSLGVSMEGKLWSDQVNIFGLQQKLDTDYTSYVVRTKQSNLKPLSRSEYDTGVMSAYNRNDIHEVPEIANGAKTIRKDIEAANKKMLELKLISEETAEKINRGDMMRVYDRNAIIADRAGFRKTLTDHILENQNISTNEAKSLADDSINTILGIGDDQIAMSDLARTALDTGARFTKPRTIDIPNSKIEKYLVNDATGVSYLYLTKAYQMIRFQEALDSMGFSSLADMRTSFSTEANEALVALEAKTLKNKKLDKATAQERYNKGAAKINKTTSDSLNLANDFAEIMLGQYGHRTGADKALRLFRSYNYTRLLGWVTISSIPDIAMPIFKHGLAKTTANYRNMIKAFADGTSKLHKADLQALGVGIEMLQDNVLKQILDPDFSTHLARGLDKGANVATDIMAHASGIKYWNNAHKLLAGFSSQTRIFQSLINYAKISSKERTYLNSLGIDSSNVDLLLKQYEKYGSKGTDGITPISGVSNWDNPEAIQILTNAVQKDVRSTIITPGKGDVPRLVQKYELAKTLFQFKSFLAASTGKVLIKGLQESDFNALVGVTSLMALGSMSYIVRQSLAGKEVDLGSDRLLLEGLNRSGVLGLIQDPLFGVVLNNGIGGKVPSRLQNQSRVEYFLGPGASALKSLSNVYGDVSEFKWDETTSKQGIKLVPYNNLFYLNNLFNK